MAAGLPPNHRYITSHNSDGKSVHIDAPQQKWRERPGLGFFARSYAVANVPAILAKDADIQAYLAGSESVTSVEREDIVIPTEDGKYNGAHMLVVDFTPGGFSPLHRTVSIDLVVCCLGTIVQGETFIRRSCVYAL